jgi:hypothetical protein
MQNTPRAFALEKRRQTLLIAVAGVRAVLDGWRMITKKAVGMIVSE